MSQTRGKLELTVPSYVTRELKQWLTRKHSSDTWTWMTYIKRGMIQVTFEHPDKKGTTNA